MKKSVLVKTTLIIVLMLLIATIGIRHYNKSSVPQNRQKNSVEMKESSPSSDSQQHPPDDEIIKLIADSWPIETRGHAILLKKHCDKISSTAQTNGVQDAWIVEYVLEFFDTEEDNWASNHDNIEFLNDKDGVILKEKGVWTFKRRAKCP